MSARPLVLLLDDVHRSYAEEIKLFNEADADLVMVRHPDPDLLKPLLPRVDALCVNIAPVGADLIAAMTRCRVIARYGVGYDNVDVGAATRAGIWVANCRHYCDEETSDQAMGLLLGCLRAVARRDRVIRAGGWTPAQDETGAFRLRGKTVSVFGFGGSGQAMTRKLAGFLPAEILVVDPTESAEVIAAAGARKATLEEALSRADVVSLHLPLHEGTRRLFRRETFSMMKAGSVLINVSRGAVVATDDLLEALDAGRPAAAGLDVHEIEPLPVDHPLRRHPATVLSDHFGWYSRESFSELKTMVARNVLEVFAGRPPLHPVNRPALPRAAS